jgi:hypothetical protein
MKRPVQHEIDQEAQKCLKAALPSSWVITEQRPDYGKDYLIDIVENGELTGLNFFVQLKGTTSASYSKDKTVPFRLERKHAIFYAEKVLQPVFLVLVDVKKQAGYWLFLQCYLLDDLADHSWKSKKQTSVKIPAENLLTDTDALEEAVIAATNYMAALHPVSIGAAINAQKARLERKDRRFQIQVTATEKGQVFSLSPKEPVELLMTFIGEQHELEAKFTDLFERGLPVSFKPQEIEFSGSPLIEELWKDGGVLKFGAQIDATVDLIARDSSDREVARISIPGLLNGGSQEQRFEGQLPRAPLKFYATVRRSAPESPLRIAFDIPQWHGQPLTMLSHFEKIACFLGAIREGASLGFEFYIDGNLFFGAYAPPELPPQLYRNADVTAVLRRAREIAQLTKINPDLPNSFGPKHAEEIDRLHALLTKSEYQEKASGYTITIHCAAQAIRKILAEPQPETSLLGLHSEGDVRLPFLGTEVDIGRLEHVFTHACIANRKRVEEQLASVNTTEVSVRFVTSAKSTYTIRRTSTSTPEPGD